MKARITYPPDRDVVEIRFTEQMHDGRIAAHHISGNGHWIVTWVEEGGLIPPVTLRPDLFAALRDELAINADAARAIRGHRDDAVEVRDRLLTLLERES